MDMQKTTSKTSLLNLMLLRAWRERWTDAQWGTTIKTVLPNRNSGDVYNLTDCILQQAVVGSDANRLLLSYLRHSLYSHLVSHASILRTISKYERFDKPYCIIAMLSFLDTILSGVTCRSKAEEALLANASLSMVCWLEQIYGVMVERHTAHGSLDAQHLKILKLLASVLDKIGSNHFLLGILYVGKHEDNKLMAKIQTKYSEVVNASGTVNFSNTYQTQNFEDVLRKMAVLDIDSWANPNLDKSPESVTFCLQPLIAVEVLLNPNNSTQTYVSLLQMIQRVKNYSTSRLYCELIRSCLSSWCNVTSTAPSSITVESLWCAFTFYKGPQILKELHNLNKGSSDSSLDFSQDVLVALELLIEDPMLDYLDAKYDCNTLEPMLKELWDHGLLNERQFQHFVSERANTSAALSGLEMNNAPPTIIPLVKQSKGPLQGILKSMELDYNKMQENLRGMLHQVLTGSGNNFDLILSHLTVEGKLKTFVSRLIRFNENSKQVVGEIESASRTRAELFDVSFLILTNIVQRYGSDAVLDAHGDTFFEKWVHQCMMERNKHKSPLTIVHQCDQAKVDELLTYLGSADLSLSTSSLKWQEICTNIPGVLYHLLLAWENDTISAKEVRTHLNGINSRFRMYSVCAVSWLCSYIQMVREEEHLKPLNMIQEFLAPLSSEELLQQDYMKDRHGLSCRIIRTMQQDVHQNQNMRTVCVQPPNIVSQHPLEEQFVTVWKSIDERGWLPVESAQLLESLLQSCGSFWLVSKLTNEILQCKYSTDMNKVVDIVFAVMHINIRACTVSLLSEFLPMLLLNKVQKFDLVEPQSTSLARLCVYCIISSLELSLNTNSRKRAYNTVCDPNDIGARMLKIRKLNPDESSNSSLNDYPMQDDFGNGITNTMTEQNAVTIKEPLHSCLQNLFKMFAQFTIADDLSPRICFIFQFLTLLQQCGKDRVTPVLKLLPSGLIQNLLKVMGTNDFTYDFILKIYDLNINTQRNNAISDLCLLRTIELRKNSINL